ncbi:MAG: hypothetical protein ACLS6G_12545 [Christensenellales bacterium]|mgnify:FL=1|jgi:hypothetical protein
MTLTHDEHSLLTQYRALSPDKQKVFLEFQRALNRGDLEACRAICEENGSNAILACPNT